MLRDELGLQGTKFGCGKGLCGACTVLVNNTAVRSCQLPIAAAENLDITTIEGLSDTADHPVQQAWVDRAVPQCGYCQSGQILTAVALLKSNPQPSDEDISQAMTNLCRCSSYQRIRDAIHNVAKA